MVFKELEVTSVVCAIYFLAAQICFTMGENKFLLPPQGCICPGSNLTFECAIEGGGTTVWSGSFITNCQSVGTEISLRHSDQFTQGYETCNNGAVTVIPLSVMINNNTTSYTSQLHINMTMISLLNGSTVTCAHDQYDGNDKTIVGSWTMIDPPMNLRLEQANGTHLKFKWDPVLPSCPSFRYNIRTTNCGFCGSESNDSATVWCENSEISTETHMCSIAVQTGCGEATGNMSDIFQVVLKVPEAPLLLITPSYAYKTGDVLLRLNVTINEAVVPVSVPTSPGSENYTIIYSDAYMYSDTKCRSEVLPVSSCEHSACQDMFEVSNSSCSSVPNIIVTAFATNMFGESPHTILFADGINRLINIEFMERMVVCKFLNDPTNGPKFCVANFTYGSNCENQLEIHENYTDFGDSVVIYLQNLTGVHDMYNESDYCFVILTNNGTTTVLIEGRLNASIIIGSGDRGPDINVAIVATVVIIIGVITALIMGFYLVYWCKQSTTSKCTSRVTCIELYVEDKPGCLLRALRVFKNQNISISSVETCPSQPGDKMKGFQIRYDCSRVFNVKTLMEQLKSKDVGAKHVRVFPETDDVQELQMTLQFTVKHIKGALVHVLTVLEKYGISIDRLDTVTFNKEKKPSDVRRFIVECHLSKHTRELLRDEIKTCGAMDVMFETKVPLQSVDEDIECATIKSQIENHTGSFHDLLEHLTRILKDNDRELPFVNMGPGNTQKQQQVCLVCAYPRKKKEHLEKEMSQAFEKDIVLQTNLKEMKEGEISVSVGGDYRYDSVV